MSSGSWFILILLIFAMLSYLFLKSKNKAGKIEEKLANLMSSKGETLITRLETATLKEKAKAEELSKILEAKRKLAIARATSAKLRKEIAGISETNVDIGQDTKSTPAKKETRQRAL